MFNVRNRLSLTNTSAMKSIDQLWLMLSGLAKGSFTRSGSLRLYLAAQIHTQCFIDSVYPFVIPLFAFFSDSAEKLPEAFCRLFLCPFSQFLFYRLILFSALIIHT
jgi:hypothetical protein